MAPKSRPVIRYPSAHIVAPASTLTRIRRVKSSLASRRFPSPIFFIMTALPPVASMVDTAVTSWITGAVRLMADRALEPMRFDTKRPSTIV